MWRCLLILTLALSSLGFGGDPPPAAQAQADAARQAFENVTFIVDGPQITQLTSIGLTGPSVGPVTWLIPLPAEPLTVQFERADTLTEYERFTLPLLNTPPLVCRLSHSAWIGEGPRFPPPDILGARLDDEAHAYGVFHGGSAAEVRAAIEAAGFTLDDWLEAAIASQPNDTYYLVFRAAWPLIEEWETFDEYRLPLVVVTYAAEAVELPARAAQPGASDPAPMTIWIVGAQPYAPTAAAAPLLPDWSQSRAQAQQVHDMGQFALRNLNSPPPWLDYARVRDRTLAEHPDQPFLTEYVGPPLVALDRLLPADILPETADEAIVTRLRTRFAPADFRQPLTFVPAPGWPTLTEVDLGDIVNPITYWGCTSETVQAPPPADALPAHTRIDRLRLAVAHPAGWVSTQLQWDAATTVYTLAPAALTAEALRTAFADGAPFPIFMAFAGPSDAAYIRGDYIETYRMRPCWKRWASFCQTLPDKLRPSACATGRMAARAVRWNRPSSMGC